MFLGNDNNLLKEYLSKVDKGAYLHKYAGLWALGLDLLPTPAERHLHLFVHGGCACSINVWVKFLIKIIKRQRRRPVRIIF